MECSFGVMKTFWNQRGAGSPLKACPKCQDELYALKWLIICFVNFTIKIYEEKLIQALPWSWAIIFDHETTDLRTKADMLRTEEMEARKSLASVTPLSDQPFRLTLDLFVIWFNFFFPEATVRLILLPGSEYMLTDREDEGKSYLSLGFGFFQIHGWYCPFTEMSNTGKGPDLGWESWVQFGTFELEVSLS